MIQNKIKFFIIFFASWVSACSESKSFKGKVFFENCDNHMAWNENNHPSIIKVPDAPSGVYACGIKDENPYSITLHIKTNEISKNPLKKVEFSAKVNMSTPAADPLIVLDVIDKDGKSIEWIPMGIDDKNNNYGKWVNLKNSIDLTIKNRNLPDNSFKIYVSNGTKDVVFVDDISVEFFD